jgi:hypothetical protein
MADIILSLTILLLFVNVLLNKKPALLTLICVYFYVSIILFTRYGWVLSYLFPLALIFSLALGYVARKIERPFIHLVNFLLVFVFFGIFWLRRLVIRDSPEFLTEFFIYGSLFYIVFYAMLIYAATAKEKPMNQWMQWAIGWANLVFFAGMTSYVIIHYCFPDYLWVMVTGLLLFHLIVLYLTKQYQSLTWVVSNHFIVMVLAALIGPLVIMQNMVLLFAAGLSIFMLMYAGYSKNRMAAWISFGAMGCLMVNYLYEWIFSYLPASFFEKKLPDSGLLWHGIIGGIIVVAALGVSIWLFKDTELELSKKWFSRSAYSRITHGGLFVSIFLTLGWLGFSLLCLFTGTLDYTSVGWAVTGSLFFIGLINYYSGEISTFKKPAIYFGFAFVLLYPLTVYWNMTITLDNLIHDGSIITIAWVLHYLALGLIIVLGAMSARRFYRLNSSITALRRGLQMLTIIFILFLLCTEYDNLSVLVLSLQNGSNSGSGIGSEILGVNQHLPYSIMMWSLSVFVFIRALFYHNRFLRSFAIVLYVLVLIKLFAFDFETLGNATRSAIFFVIGFFLIGFSFLYPRLLKADAKLREENRGFPNVYKS